MTQAIAQEVGADGNGAEPDTDAPVSEGAVTPTEGGLTREDTTGSAADLETGADAGVAQVGPVDQSVDALVAAVDLFDAGGPVVLILTVMSVFALAIIIAKLVQFASAGMGGRQAVRESIRLMRAGRTSEAFARLRSSRNAAAQIFAMAIASQARGVPEDKIREASYCEAQLRTEALRGWMRPLEVIATLAPLLGLFGTVLGMIEAFGQLEAAGSQVDPAILSGGIWEALLTTAVGLAVAIPVVAAVNWFERRIERVEHDIDTGLAALFSAAWDDALPGDDPAVAPMIDPSQRYGDASHGLRPAAAGE